MKYVSYKYQMQWHGGGGVGGGGERKVMTPKKYDVVRD